MGVKEYLYIFAIVIVLLLPKEDEIIALLSNQFLGIATITALAREARGKLVEFTTIWTLKEYIKMMYNT